MNPVNPHSTDRACPTRIAEGHLTGTTGGWIRTLYLRSLSVWNFLFIEISGFLLAVPGDLDMLGANDGGCHLRRCHRAGRRCKAKNVVTVLEVLTSPFPVPVPWLAAAP